MILVSAGRAANAVTTPATSSAPATRPARPRWPPRPQGSKQGLDLSDDGVEIGKLSCFQLGINLFAIDGDFKDAAARWNQSEGTDLLLEHQKFFRQTDGFGFVASSSAIFNGDFQAHIGET